MKIPYDEVLNIVLHNGNVILVQSKDRRDGDTSTSTTDKIPKFRKWAITATDLTKLLVDGEISKWLITVRSRNITIKLASIRNP